eukprot:IDg4233t1
MKVTVLSALLVVALTSVATCTVHASSGSVAAKAADSTASLSEIASERAVLKAKINDEAGPTIDTAVHSWKRHHYGYGRRHYGGYHRYKRHHRYGGYHRYNRYNRYRHYGRRRHYGYGYRKHH